MQVVEPIRDEYVLEDILRYLKYKNANTEYQQYMADRNYIMLYLGFNSGLRISDIVRIRCGDIDNDHFRIREKKTKKWQTIYLNKTASDELNEYISRYDMKKSDYLFTSRTKDKKTGKKKPITTKRAYQIIKQEIEPLFDVERIGTHTLRKTFGYMYYKQTHDIAMLQQLFNHSSEKITLAYIGITDDAKNDARRSFSILNKRI